MQRQHIGVTGGKDTGRTRVLERCETHAARAKWREHVAELISRQQGGMQGTSLLLLSNRSGVFQPQMHAPRPQIAPNYVKTL
jgi:hypothetical protein